MIDSGSISTFIDKSIANKLKLPIIPKTKIISLANPDLKANIIGEVTIDTALNNIKHNSVTVEVIDKLFIDIIIGKDILKKHKKVTFKFNGSENELIIRAVGQTEHFPQMKVNPPPLFTHLSDNIKLVPSKSRRYTQSDQKFIKEETTLLLKEGIIERSVSPWRAQVLVTSNENHKRRMVIDYSNTINMFTELDAYPMPNIIKMINDISKYKYFTTLHLKLACHQVPIKEEDRKYTAFEIDGKLYQFTRLPFGVTNGVSAFQTSIHHIIEVEKLDDTFAYIDNLTVCGRTLDEHSKNLEKVNEILKKYNITFNENKSIICATSITHLGYIVSHNKIAPDYNRLKPLLETIPPSNLKSQKRIVGMFSYYNKFIKNFSDKIYPLNHNETFPLPPLVLNSFQILKDDLKNAVLVTVDYDG